MNRKRDTKQAQKAKVGKQSIRHGSHNLEVEQGDSNSAIGDTIRGRDKWSEEAVCNEPLVNKELRGMSRNNKE